MKRPQGPPGTPQSRPQHSSQAAPQPVKPQPPTRAQQGTSARPSRAERKQNKADLKKQKKSSAASQSRSGTRAPAPAASAPTGSRVQGTLRPVGAPARPKSNSAQSDTSASRTTKAARKLTASQQEALEAKRKLKEAVKARKAFERDEVRRFTAHLRRRRIVWASIAGSFVAILIFVGVGMFTPILALQNIVVEGATRVPADQIIASLQPELNKPLPLVDMGAVRKAVEAQPLVKSYSTVAVPPHTLVVKVVERAPVGYLPSPNGFIMVDPAGVVIEETPERVPGLPLLTVEGDSARSKGFAAAIDVINSLPAGLAGQLDEVIANTTDDVTLILTGGARVFWGGPENAAMKNRVLSQLLTLNPVGSVSEYDVSSPKTAVVR